MSLPGGMEKVALTQGLLELIMMVQDYKRFQLSKYQFNKFHGGEKLDWHEETERFFSSLDEILAKYKLSKNKISFEKVLSYQVTDEMMSTLFAELPEKFMF